MAAGEMVLHYQDIRQPCINCSITTQLQTIRFYRQTRVPLCHQQIVNQPLFVLSPSKEEQAWVGLHLDYQDSVRTVCRNQSRNSRQLAGLSFLTESQQHHRSR